MLDAALMGMGRILREIQYGSLVPPWKEPRH